MRRNFVFIFVAVSIPLFIMACKGDKSDAPKAPPPVQVSVYLVKPGIAYYYDEYPATVTALNQVELRPEVSGLITGIYFKDGQRVRKGMKLYSIDQQQYQAAYEQSIANLNAAKSNLSKAQQDADRYQMLAQKDAIARQQLEHAMADLQTAKMQVRAAEANVQGVQTNLRYSTIVAPFDGTIGISSVKMGSAVTTGQTLLNTISADDPMAVDFGVDEKEINRYSQLLNKKPDKEDSTFTILLPDQTIYPYPGKLSLLDRAVDPQTGTIRARVIFPNPKDILKSGLTCNLRVRNNSAPGSLLIPYRAVTEQMGEYFIFVVNGNKVTQRKITLGQNIRDMAVVKEGVKPGEQVVTEGMQKLKDNAVIAIKPQGTTPNPPQTAQGK